jgi:hypothetical protein
MGLIEVKYKGLSDIRTITKKNWEQEGVGLDKDTTWDASNRFTLLIDANERMEEVLRAQGHFQLSKVDDAGNREVFAEATEPDREPDVIVDGNTGQSTEVKKDEPAADTLVPEGGSAGAGAGSGRTGRGASTGGTGTTAGGRTGKGSSTATSTT